MTYTVYMGYEESNVPSLDVLDALTGDLPCPVSVERALDGTEVVLFGAQQGVNAVHALLSFRDTAKHLLAKYGHHGSPSVMTVRLDDPDAG